MSKLIEIPIHHREPTHHRTPFILDGERFVAVYGGTGSGKTTWVCHKFVPNMAKAGICYIASSDILQEPYLSLSKHLENEGVQVIRRNKIDPEEIAGLSSEFKKHDHNIFIFDDFKSDDLEKIIGLAKEGRHTHKCSIIYITHMFAKELPQEIRANLNTMVIFQTDDVNTIAQQQLCGQREFKKMLKEVTAIPYTPLTIWKGIVDPAMRIRRDLTGIISKELPPDVQIKLHENN